MVLSETSKGTNNLTWRFRFTEADLFVDAHSGQIVFATSNMHTAREIYDGAGAPPSPGTIFSTLILRDGVNVAPTPANNPDVVPADARLATSIPEQRYLNARAGG